MIYNHIIASYNIPGEGGGVISYPVSSKKYQFRVINARYGWVGFENMKLYIVL
jgi:hypothetical protein